MSMKMKRHVLDLLVMLLALAAGLLVVLPLIYGVFGAFRTPAEFAAWPPAFLPRSFANLDNFRRVLTMVPMGRYFLNSLIVATLTSAVRLVLAVLSAYAFVFFRFPGRSFLFFFLLGTMMLPGDTMLVTNYQTVARLGLLDTYTGMSIIAFVGASQMFMLRQAFRASPAALRDAAMLDGCGDLRFIGSILIPVTRPVLVTLFTQSFVTAWNSYLWPLMVTNHNDMRTVQVGITMLTTIEDTNYEVVLAGVALSLIPALVLFLAMRRSITGAVTAGSLVG